MFFIYILLLILPVVITVAFYTLAERKIIAAIQRRTGPNVVGFWGLLQPFADGLKAILKEQIKPLRAVFYLFLFAPMLTFFLSLLALNFICFQIDRSYFDEYLNFLFFFSISSFNVFGIIFAGWSSNSKYTLLGALRAAAQTFSFEMCFITLLLPIFLLNSTFNFIDIVNHQSEIFNIYVFFPLGIYFYIILLAETNRTPFDLPEAEAELVAGYNLEYSAINFALFFLVEYSNMLLNSCIFVIFFLGGWHYDHFFLLEIWKTFFDPIKLFLYFIYSFIAIFLIFIKSCFFIIGEFFFSNVFLEFFFFNFQNIYFNNLIKYISVFVYFICYNFVEFFLNIFFIFFISSQQIFLSVVPKIFFGFLAKVIFIACLFIIVRALLPRYRFDQLMDLCWKKILPVGGSFFLFFITLIYFFNGFLYNVEINILNPKMLIIIYYNIF